MTNTWMPYALLTEVQPISSLPTWPAVQSSYQDIVGYSGLGHMFLRSAAREYAVLHPFRTTCSNYGTFSSCQAFEQYVLSNPVFAGQVLRRGHQLAIREFLGPLEEDEIYIPTPYPFLGGDERPENYDRGDVWVFLDIVGQMLN